MEGVFKIFGLTNIHPVIIHFPLAFGILYGILEIIPIKSLDKSLFTTKAILAILSFVSIFAARQAGEVAKIAYNDERTLMLINTHQTFGDLSLYVFGIIFLIYIVQIAGKAMPELFKNRYAKYLVIFSSNGVVHATFALLGLILVSLAGVLGGIIVWGPDNDPFSKAVYSLLFGS